MAARRLAQQQQARLRATLHSLLDPHVLVEAVRAESGAIVDFEYLDANPAACEYNRLSYDELVGARLMDLLPGHLGSGLLKMYADVVDSGRPLVLSDFSYDHELQGGVQRYFDIQATKVGDGLAFTWRDVTERHLAQKALAASESRYRLLAENVSDMVMQLARDGSIAWVSESVTSVLGWDKAQILGTYSLDLLHEDDRERAATQRDRWDLTQPIKGEYRVLCADGSSRAMHIDIHAVAVEADGFAIVAMRDIQDEVTTRELLLHAIEHDRLTGLANRSVALTRIDRFLKESDLLQRSHEVGVLCVGVDNLKLANEAYSYAVGDHILATLAQRIASAMRDPDLVARGSGDEFLVLLPDLVTGADAGVVAEQIRLAARGSISLDGQPFETSVSIGIASGSRTADSETLVRNASLAMHRAKDAGRDRCEFFEARLAELAWRRLSIETGIREGLARQEFVPWYQPVVDLGSGVVVGYEALVRWVRPGAGVVGPDDFLPIAERSVLIVELDMMVLAQSIEFLSKLPEAQHVAVNVSATTLTSVGYGDQVRRLLKQNRVNPHRLILEVTETTLLMNGEEVAAIMRDLAAVGIRWYADDFGTGYSSISHLRDLPVAGLKLDLSFTAGITISDDAAVHLALGLAGLAVGLDLDTVAEGIETMQQAAVLREQGWKHGQGWLFGRARPASQIVHQSP
ncbi:MAG: EAL domain-containing protein [Actinomycetes bacterium]